VTHIELNWEYVIIVSKKKGTLVAHTSTFHAKWETMLCLLLPVWTKTCTDFGHLPTQVPFAMPNHFDGGKEEMFTM
jgi:hypothetical protein